MSVASETAEQVALAALLRPSVFPHPVGRIEVRETHISYVILTGTFAYKIKKAIRLEFIDAASLDKRRELCETELRLNKRLASSLYVDVVALACDERGCLRFAGQGRVVEYAVRMRQFDSCHELHRLLDQHAVTIDEMRALGKLLARFHGDARLSAPDDAYGGVEQIDRAVHNTLAQLRAHNHCEAEAVSIAGLSVWMETQLARLKPLLLARKQSRAIRECHGDLHVRNIVRWQGRLVPFDCLEFDPALRWIDVIDDLAFLTMDLSAHGRNDLGFVLLNAYLDDSGDYEGMRLLAFYSVHRALIRAMVDAVSSEQQRPNRTEFTRRLHDRLLVAERFTAPLAPLLILMHGVSGSGKSWLSERLIPLLPAVRIRSDVERKRLAAALPSADDSQQLYGADFDESTYARMFECAEHCLGSGLNTVVDAAFLKREQRKLFYRLADNLGVSYLVLACVGDVEMLSRRIEQRCAAHADPSDATVTVLQHQLRNAQPLDEFEYPRVMSVDTSQPQTVERTFAAVQARRLGVVA